jgi:hypothetical protein
MQLMGHSISIFGGRFGIAFDPAKKHADLIRHDAHPGLPFEIAVGFDLNGRRAYLPLSSEGERFEFCDFDTTATSMRMIGIDPGSGIRIALRVQIPFRPRDIEFSVTPAIFLDVECERIENIYRWARMEDRDKSIRVRFFIEFKNTSGSAIFNYTAQPGENRIKIEYKSPYRDLKLEPKKYIDSINYLDVLQGSLEGRRVFGDFSLKPGEKASSISLALVTYDEPVLHVLGDKVPFKYSQYFNSIDEVNHVSPSQVWSVCSIRCLYDCPIVWESKILSTFTAFSSTNSRSSALRASADRARIRARSSASAAHFCSAFSIASGIARMPCRS